MSRESAIPNAKALLNLLEQFELYTKNLQKQPLSMHTKRAYETRLQHFLGFLGTHLGDYPDALSNQHTRDYVTRDYMQYLKLQIKSSPQTVNAYLTAIDSFFVFLGLGKPNATRENSPNFAPRALSGTEQKEFLKAIEETKRARDRAVATLLLSSGIRISECRQLNVADIHCTERKTTLAVRDQKGEICREISLSTSCRIALQDWLKDRQGKYSGSSRDALFISNRGTRLSVDAIDHIVRKIAGRAKLCDVSSHILRNTCLTNLIEKGVDAALVSKVGGHKKLQTTKRYNKQNFGVLSSDF